MSENDTEIISAYCPVTGIPLSSRPDWNMVQIGSEVWVTFEWIGDLYLWISFYGKESLESNFKFLEIRGRVIKESHKNPDSIYEIRDYSNITLTPYDGFSPALYREHPEFASGFKMLYVVNPPHYIAAQYSPYSEGRLYSTGVRIKSHYSDAVCDIIQEMMQTKRVDFSKSVFWREDGSWEQKTDELSFRLERIQKDILHITGSGVANQNTFRVLLLAQRVYLERFGAELTPYFRITGMNNVSLSSWKDAKFYFDRVVHLNKLFPSQGSVAYGLGSFYRTLASMIQLVYPFHLIVKESLEDSLSHIQNKKTSGSKEDSMAVSGIQKVFTEKEIEIFNSELLSAIGSLYVDKPGLENFPRILPSHPMIQVMEALKVFKIDVDKHLEESSSFSEKVLGSLEDIQLMLKNSAKAEGEQQSVYRDKALNNIQGLISQMKFWKQR